MWDLFEAGPLTVRDMAAIQRADHSLISRALPGLQAKNLIVLARDETDKRQTMVALTDAGQDAHAAAAPYMEARRDRMRALFTADELTQFVALIDKFEAFLDAEARNRLSQQETCK